MDVLSSRLNYFEEKGGFSDEKNFGCSLFRVSFHGIRVSGVRVETHGLREFLHKSA
jgi:hypothetical protein